MQWVACGKSSILHKGMLYAAKAMAMTAVDLLYKKEIIEEAKKEFDERIGENKYFCYIPDSVKPE